MVCCRASCHIALRSYNIIKLNLVGVLLLTTLLSTTPRSRYCGGNEAKQQLLKIDIICLLLARSQVGLKLPNQIKLKPHHTTLTTPMRPQIVWNQPLRPPPPPRWLFITLLIFAGWLTNTLSTWYRARCVAIKCRWHSWRYSLHSTSSSVSF